MGTPHWRGKVKKVCYAVMEISDYFLEIVCIELYGRILDQNFPFSSYPALIVLDLCDVNRIFKRAPISKRSFSPFAFAFTSRKTVRSFLVKGHHYNRALKKL